MNLKAIRQIVPNVSCAAVEINHKAAEMLRHDAEFHNSIEIYEQSILGFAPPKRFDMALIKGVLIHINPKELDQVYQILYDSSDRYICIAEYYNPSPVDVLYRGDEGKLFKRDFAGELLDRFQDVQLLDYGFVYHRDNCFPQDDITWFLLEKDEKK